MASYTLPYSSDMKLLTVSQGNPSGGYPGEAGTVQEARETTSLPIILQNTYFALPESRA